MSSLALASNFRSLGVSEWIVKNCEAMGINQPTEIQKGCIPKILNHQDVIGQAKTGSGKTAAFALPIIELLSNDPYGVYALILTPSRELAFQINEQFIAFLNTSNLTSMVIVGGLDMMKQATLIRKRPNIVISTPGRLADLLKSSVLDEADRLLSGDISNDLEIILANIPSKNRQTLLFSATITKSITTIQGSSTRPTYLFESKNDKEFELVEKLSQYYLFIPEHVKECYLAFLLRELVINNEDDEENPKKPKSTAIVFVKSCNSCQLISNMLKILEIPNACLHSKLPQNLRLTNLAQFKSGSKRILIATDVAARGLDIPTVQRVINFDLPRESAEYVHRVGRTARAGRSGDAITFVTQYDVTLYEAIESHLGRKLDELKLSEDKVLDMLQKVSEAKRKATMQVDREGLYKKENLKLKMKEESIKQKREEEFKKSKKSKLNPK